MNALDLWVRTAQANAVGWTLLHSLWEGAAVALALAVVLGLARSPRVRYAAACFAMLAIMAAFGATFYRLMPEAREGPAIRPTLPSAVILSTDRTATKFVTPWVASDLLPWLAPLWMAGVLLFQLRCVASWMAARRLRRIGICGAPDAWASRLDALRVRLRMAKPVLLLESCFAEVPVVAGYLRPMILIPVGLLAGLPVGQIEAILLHELAHIRREDYLVNLIQTFFEGLLFYHPAVWWISGVIRSERENCCDDVVIATSGDRHEYATALAALAEIRWELRGAAVAATGGNLANRVRRVLAQPESPRTAMAPIASAGILIGTCAVALAAWPSPQQSGLTVAVPHAPAARVQSVESKSLEELHLTTQKRTAPFSTLLAQNNAGPLANPLPAPYQRWLNEEVVYIITPAERSAFLTLRTDGERNIFIGQFWARRDPLLKGNPENEYKKEHYRRIAYVNARFEDKTQAGWRTDRGRIYIRYGPPDEIESHPSGGRYTRPPEAGGGQTTTFPFEQWMYRFIEGVGKNVIMEFVDKAGTGEYLMTTDPKAKEAQLQAELFSSSGPGEKAVVLVEAGGQVRVTIPIDYDATEFSAKVDSSGKTVMRISHGALPDPCDGKSKESGCEKTYVRTIPLGPMDPGSYVFSAEVKDSGTRSEKDYVVNFSVK